MGYKASNNADTTLSESITPTSTTISVATGHGDDFPTLGASDWTLITITDKNGAREIIKIIARTGDTMTVGTTPGGEADVGGRAQEGTTALSITYTDDHSVRCCPTAGLIEAMADYSDQGDLTATPAEIEAVCKGNTATAAEITQVCDGNTATAAELSELNESGVVKADLVKLHDITSSATEINQLHESGVVKADFEKLHDITVPATQINTIGKIKARAYRKNAQNIGEERTKILIDTVNFDPEEVVSITNSRITPNLPGYYMVIGNIQVSYVQAHHWVKALICRNGSPMTICNGTFIRQSDIGRASSIAQDLVYMNGATDYLELYAYSSYSGALALYAGQPHQNYISILGPF